MNVVSYMASLAEQAAEVLIYLAPITAGFLLLFLGALFWDLTGARLKFNARLFYLLLPGVSILLILLAGALFHRKPEFAFLPHIGCAVGVLLAIVPAVQLRPAWATSITSSLCLLWYSYCCWFVSIMSIRWPAGPGLS